MSRDSPLIANEPLPRSWRPPKRPGRGRPTRRRGGRIPRGGVGGGRRGGLERARAAGPVLVALVLAVVLTLFAFTREGWAQEDAASALRRLGTENARLFLHPVTSGLGAAINSGFFHSADVHEPFGFDVSVRAMGALLPEEADRFRPALPASVTCPPSLPCAGTTYERPYATSAGATTPTAVGDGPGIVAVPRGEFRQALIDAGEDPSDYGLPFPAGLGLPAVTFSLLQVGLGLPAGTEVAVRFTPTVELGEEVGSVSLLGVGLRHSLDRWLPLPAPMRLSVSGGMQRLRVGDYLEMTARQASVVAGARVGPLSPYVAGGLEGASADVDYLLENETGNPALPEGGTRIRFRDEADNAARGVAGLTLHLGPVMLNGEYALSRVSVASAKLILGWR